MTVFNFPDTDGQPTDGTFQWTSPTGRVYIWDGYSWTSKGDGSGGGGGDANITVTDNLGSISQPGQGDLAYHTVEARMYIYYEDDDSKQWVDASPGGDTIDETPDDFVFMPTGGGDEPFINRAFYENSKSITEDYTITDDRNAMSAGPITIEDGVTVTVGEGENWTVIGGASSSVDPAGYWEKDGTTLKPANAGDDVVVTRDAGQQTVFSAYTAGNSEPTLRLFANGTITSTEQIQTTGIITARDVSDPTNKWCYLTNNGLVFNSSEVRITNSSSVGVGFNSGQTAWAAVSQRSLKTGFEPITSGLEKVATLSAVTGRYKFDEVGVSRSFLFADEVKEVLPEAVSGDGTEDNPLELRYTEVIPLLVSALHDAKDRIEALEEKLNTLEGGIATADITDGGNN